jgi:hypothetical protein
LCRVVGRKRAAVANRFAKQNDQALGRQKLMRQSAKNEPVRLCFGNRGWSLAGGLLFEPGGRTGVVAVLPPLAGSVLT